MRALGYPTIRLGEAVDRITKGTTPTTHGYAYTDEGVSFLRVENLQNGIVDTSKVKTFISHDADRFLKRSTLESGDVLISIAGTIGRVAIVRDHDIPANTNQAVAIIRGVTKRFVPNFLRYALESPLLHGHITGEARGGAMQNISLENVRNIVVPLPPLPEQRRIVAEIEKQFTRLDAGVAALRRVQANLKRYHAAVLKAACEGRLVPTEAEFAKNGKRKAKFETGEALLARILAERRHNWQGRGKYREPAAPDSGKLPVSLPEDWACASFDQITVNFDGRRVPLKSSDRNMRPGQYPYYGASGIIDDIDGFLFDGDFLLIAEDGANLLSRSTPIAFKANGKFWVNNHAHITQAQDRISLAYLSIYLNGIDISFSVTGTAQPKLTQAALNRIPVPLPPIAEQERIVAEVDRRLSVVEELESVVSANLQRATRLRQSILQKAFSGKL